jgi:hypothetical protein
MQISASMAELGHARFARSMCGSICGFQVIWRMPVFYEPHWPFN